jgi:hypothetical protein
MAGWRGVQNPKVLKPIDKVSLGEITSHRAVTTVNANVASKMRRSEGRARNRRAKAAWVPKSDRRGIATSAGWKRQHGDKDIPRNWRSPSRPGAKSLEQGRSYNRLNREVDRRREGGGWARSSEEAE